MITIIICCLLIQYLPTIIAVYALVMFIYGMLNN